MTNEATETHVLNELDDAQLMYLGMLRDSGCKFLQKTQLFGKSYVWMRDAAGTIFLERIPEIDA